MPGQAMLMPLAMSAYGHLSCASEVWPVFQTVDDNHGKCMSKSRSRMTCPPAAALVVAVAVAEAQAVAAPEL
jgi:hypothetical protein